MRFLCAMVILVLFLFGCSETTKLQSNDARIQMFEELQNFLKIEIYRGNERKFMMHEVLSDRTNSDGRKMGDFYIETSEKADKLILPIIEDIDKLKQGMFKYKWEWYRIGSKKRSQMEDVNKFVYDLKEKTLCAIPYSMSLSKVDASIILLRSKLSQLMIRQHRNEEKWNFKDPQITTFLDKNDLNLKIEKAILSSNVSFDDRECLKQLYIILTELAYLEKPNDFSPYDFFAYLTTIQTKLASARALFLELVNSRYTYCGFIFRDIRPLIQGPNYLKKDEEGIFEVSIAVADDDLHPHAIINGQAITEYKDNKALFRVKYSGNDKLILNGTVGIKYPTGVYRQMPFERIVNFIE